MKSATWSFEIITPCFCGGADPKAVPEVRVPSIRGQLRWWFRTLGGFKAMRSIAENVHDQENCVFGNAAGDKGTASKLFVRVNSIHPAALRSNSVRDAAEMGADVNTPRGYLLFPLRSNLQKGEYRGRACFGAEGKPVAFDLHLQWRGDPRWWDDVQALITVFGHLGSLGFRSRRAMGALAFATDTPSLADALNRFACPKAVDVRELPAKDARDAITGLAQWLKGWRAHGRAADHARVRPPSKPYQPGNIPADPPYNPGFSCAKKDHDAGLGLYHGPVYRAALGLPIIQHFSGGRRSANWDFSWDERLRRAAGRFASPVILRPYRLGSIWKALVIFVEAHKWPSGQPVIIDGRKRAVSLDLYEAMKRELRPLDSVRSSRDFGSS